MHGCLGPTCKKKKKKIERTRECLQTLPFSPPHPAPGLLQQGRDYNHYSSSTHPDKKKSPWSPVFSLSLPGWKPRWLPLVPNFLWRLTGPLESRGIGVEQKEETWISRSQSSSKADWLHNPGAAYFPSPSLSSTFRNPYFRSVRELNDKEPLAHRGKCLFINSGSFLLPPKSSVFCHFAARHLLQLADALCTRHTHTTLTDAVSLRLVDANPNLCPKTLGSRESWRAVA